MPYHVTLDTPPSELALPQPFLPEMAVLVYTRQQKHLLLKHSVQSLPDGTCALGAGQALTGLDLEALMHVLSGVDLRFTEATTLAAGVGSLIWWVPPAARPVWFDAKYAATASIAQLSGQAVPWPGLVMRVTGGKFQVFAVRGTKRPTPKTPLMHAPFWNTFNTGVVCQGTVAYPSGCTPAQQSDWETVFFQSVFTGPSRVDRYMNWGESYEALLTQAQQLGHFPEEVLIDAGMTLAALSQS